MAKKPARPLFSVKHDFVDSLDAFIQAPMMLHNVLTSVLTLARSGQPIPEKVRAIMKERVEAWEKATLSDQE